MIVQNIGVPATQILSAIMTATDGSGRREWHYRFSEKYSLRFFGANVTSL
jgi:hypothetical protein